MGRAYPHQLQRSVMRGDEQRVVDAFAGHWTDHGWDV